ncbi:MAG: bifunctional folylpolyglutamate synthase/dihydrofolate synthase, partial [Fusobacteriaceae bacterium]
MNMKDVTKEIYGYIFMGKKYDLENIKILCENLGNPQNNYKIIHITGTNGKGSTTTLIETVLLEANFKVAKFTSPHILKINERFRFNGKDISDEDFINIYL